MLGKISIPNIVKRPAYLLMCWLLAACSSNPSLLPKPTITPNPTQAPRNTKVIVSSITRPVFGYYDDRFNALYGYKTTRETHILNADECGGGTRVIRSETFSVQLTMVKEMLKKL